MEEIKGEISDIFGKGIEIGYRHGIKLMADKSNEKAGNCLLESVIYNINHLYKIFCL